MEYNFYKIGERIYRLRKGAGWNQEQFIAKLGRAGCHTSRNTISAIENGNESKFTLELLLACCRLFGCDIGFLLGEYDGCRTGQGQFIHEHTGLTGENIRRLAAFQDTRNFGTTAAADLLGRPDPEGKLSFALSQTGLSAVNDMLDAFIKEKDIFYGYMEVMRSGSRMEEQLSTADVEKAYSALMNPVSGLEYIPLPEYIRFEADRVGRAFSRFLVEKYTPKLP